jgi:hypothetical protein
METITGKIYKIVADDTTDIYIGSTIQQLNNRLATHKHKRSCMSNKLFTYPNTRIELIEEYKCNNPIELRQREQYYINLNKDICINKFRAYRTKEEYKKDKNNSARKSYHINIEKERLRTKVYRENNKEKELLRCNIKNAKKVICDCGASVSSGGLAKHRKTNKHIELLNEKTKI